MMDADLRPRRREPVESTDLALRVARAKGGRARARQHGAVVRQFPSFVVALANAHRQEALGQLPALLAAHRIPVTLGIDWGALTPFVMVGDVLERVLADLTRRPHRWNRASVVSLGSAEVYFTQQAFGEDQDSAYKANAWTVAVLLRELAAAPPASLRLIRRCAHRACRRFFVARGPNAVKTCRPACRVAMHRRRGRNLRRRKAHFGIGDVTGSSVKQRHSTSIPAPTPHSSPPQSQVRAR